MPQLHANGIATYYEMHGSGEPLVLLHNDGLSLAVWEHLCPHLIAWRQVVAYDRRGHGRSEVPAEGAAYTLEVLAEDLRALLDALGIASLDLFGCSGGANTALAFALACPDRVRRLILAEPPIVGFQREHPIPATGLESKTIARIMREQGLEAGLEHWFRAILPEARARRILRSRHRALLLSHPPWLIEAILRAAETFDPTARLSEVKAPVLLVLGEKSHPFFGSVMDVLEPRLPHARRVVLPDVDHTGLLLPSRALLSALRTFLQDGAEPHSPPIR
jgi:pimeloyl-ACP methyl ester carboxylesterase